MSRTPSHPSRSHVYRVGDRVRVQIGQSRLTGRVVEDRGEIGVGGRQLLRISVPFGGSDETFVEMPAEQLRAA